MPGATIAALDAWAALIVVCSPIAATRPAVNEEVRLFRSRHPGRPVIPVIIEGTPHLFASPLAGEVARSAGGGQAATTDASVHRPPPLRGTSPVRGEGRIQECFPPRRALPSRRTARSRTSR